jgi:hypothetical protein
MECARCKAVRIEGSQFRSPLEASVFVRDISDAFGIRVAIMFLLTSPCLLVRLSACNITLESMNRFSWKLILLCCAKICRHIPVLVKTGQHWRALYNKKYLRFCARKWPSGESPGYLGLTLLPWLTWLSRFLLSLGILAWGIRNKQRIHVGESSVMTPSAG